MTVIEEWDRATLWSRRDDVLEVYAAAMDVPRAVARGRRGVVAGHLDRDGLRTLAAVEEDGGLVGVAYGYLGAPGQWWHDQVRTALAATAGTPACDAWMSDAFEVCELHVLPGRQGQGLGRRLLDGLLDGTAARSALLTTPDTETRARGFYRAAGWVDLVRWLRFPGDPREFAVLGLSLEGRHA